MSKHQRKPATAAPITANPLFPAVVALWFGAAFGLGSLAVRPSLLEDLVLKSHIDLVIPAAAPPLGITARILLALVLAALGAVLGIALARRLSRPKPEQRERKRGAKDLSAASPRVRNRDAHPDAPARRPISAHEEFGDEEPFETARPIGGLLGNRRRTLAISEEEPQFVPHDAAPLPGLDPVQPLDLASLAFSVDALPAAAPTYDAPPASPAPSLDWTRPAPLAEPAPISAEAAHRDGRQVFGMTQPAAPEMAPRQIFGVQADGDHVPQEFVKAAGFQTSVFDTPEPSPLFERAPEAVCAPAVSSEPEISVTILAPQAAPPQLAALGVPLAAAAMPVPAEPQPSPASLGMTDLAARLADSMRRRRERAQAAAASPASPEPATAAPVPTELPSMPAAFVAPVELRDTSERAAPAFGPHPVVAEAVQAAAPVADALPRFAPPVAETAPPSAAPLQMPAAMRPLALDAFLEDDTGFEDSSLLPPRHIAMPQAAAPFATPAAAAAPIAAEPAAPADEAESVIDESLADVADDNPYASLLAVAPVRQSHVRIEEPELAADAEIEPVVIFPGQTGQVVPLAAQTPAVAASDETTFRRFDAPGSAGQGQQVASGTSASLIPPDEAAQALRAALSNLQRMSGAA